MSKQIYDSPTQQTTMRFPDETKARVKAVAKAENRSWTNMTVMLLDHALPDFEKKYGLKPPSRRGKSNGGSHADPA